MTTELQLKKIPATVTSLIAQEASRHRRSIEQEALLLLEEALLARAHARDPDRVEIDAILRRFDTLPSVDVRPLADLIEYDAQGLPK